MRPSRVARTRGGDLTDDSLTVTDSDSVINERAASPSVHGDD